MPIADTALPLVPNSFAMHFWLLVCAYMALILLASAVSTVDAVP